MDLELTNEGKVKISMFKYLEAVIESFLKSITGKDYIMEVTHIFDVCTDFIPIAETEVMAFHNCVSKMLFATKW